MEELVMALCYLAEITAYAGFYRKIFGISKKKAALFIVILFPLVKINWMLYAQYYSIRFVFRILYCPIFICLVLLLFQGDREKKILASSILLFIRRFVWDIFDSLFSFIELLFLHVIKKEAQPVPDVDAVYSYVMICIIYGIGIMIIWCVSEYCVLIFEDKIKKWYVITAVPLFVSALLSEITVLAAGFYVFGMHRIYLEQKKKESYQAQIMSYRMLEEQYRKLERVRHDFKNHIIALQGFLEKNEWKKMKSYFQQLKIAADMEAGEEITGNVAIDALLCHKRKLAEEKNISWECDMKITPECPVDTYDLCFLLEIRNSTDTGDIRELEYSRKRK